MHFICMTGETLTIAELADLLKMSERSIRRRLPQWIERHGFPRALPGMARWSGAAVRGWIDYGGCLPPAANDHLAVLKNQFESRPV
jgi:hypothetical protein